MQREQFDRLFDGLDELDERTIYVICKRFGLGGDEAMSFQKIGGQFGPTRKRVRQIQRHALEPLRSTFQED